MFLTARAARFRTRSAALLEATLRPTVIVLGTNRTPEKLCARYMSCSATRFDPGNDEIVSCMATHPPSTTRGTNRAKSWSTMS